MSLLPNFPDLKGEKETSLPQKRRVTWEHGMDMSYAFRVLSGVTLALCVVVLVESAVLIRIYSQPPVVLDQNDGWIMWRTTDHFKLRSDMIRMYLKLTLGTLFTVTPGSYDLSSLSTMVDKSILKGFIEKGEGNTVTASNQRRLFRLVDVKRYSDPAYPQYIVLAVKAERTLYEYNQASVDPFKIKEDQFVYIVWLQREMPKPENPWGLLMVGLDAKNGADADAVWAKAASLEVQEEKHEADEKKPRIP